MLSATSIEVSSVTRETDSAQRHYRDLIAAVRLITTIQKEVDQEEGLGCLPSPAWRLLKNATQHLLKQAQAVLRGDEDPSRWNGASSGG